MFSAHAENGRVAADWGANLAHLSSDLLEKVGLTFFKHGHQKNCLAVARFLPKFADVALFLAVVVRGVDLALVLKSKDAAVF